MNIGSEMVGKMSKYDFQLFVIEVTPSRVVQTSFRAGAVEHSTEQRG